MFMSAGEKTREGHVHYWTHNFASAASSYTSVLEAGVSSVELLSGRAAAHFRMGNYARAVVDCEASLRLDPRQRDPYLWLAASLVHLNRLDEAKRRLQQGIDLFKNGEEKALISFLLCLG